MSKTLLLADDSVVIQKLVGLSFANEDVEIIATDNGDDAVTQARETRPDVILADVVMPGKSGYEVCEEIKGDPELAHIPVLLLTGTFEAFDEARATAAGANGQITKPFEAQALVERVKEVMAAPVPAPTPVASTPAAATEEAAVTRPPVDDFFDNDVTTLTPDLSRPDLLDVPTSVASPSADVTPSIPATEVGPRADAPLFGAPGEGAAEDLEPLAGNLALGESVAADAVGTADAPGATQDRTTPDDDATIAVLPDAPPPLPPSAGDPLTGFEDDYGLNELPPMPVAPPPVADLDSALDAAAPDPGATILVGIDDRNSATSPSIGEEIDDGSADLTVHAPSSAIDSTAAAGQSPPAFESPVAPESPAAATVVANLDVSLAEAPPEPAPANPEPLDLGPSNVSPSDLDFAFDVSEQAPAGATDDLYGESFSSLMDISESQILGGAISETQSTDAPAEADPIAPDPLAAGYDVSSSDLATAPASITSSPVTDSATPEPQVFSTEAPVEPGFPIEPEAEAFSPIDESPPAAPDLALGTPAATSRGDERIADLSPMVEQRIQETLEKVAWEAFSDLSESIVKQVIGRVEKIAWEVIPEMAETLVREEIRKMKGEDD